jgi:hypothetical protein
MPIINSSFWTERRHQRASSVWVVVVTALILVSVGGLLAQGACLPHTHGGAGLYNAEHDLTLLAVSGAIASVPAATLLSMVLVVVRLSGSVPSAPTAFVSRDAESRAPPA